MEGIVNKDAIILAEKKSRVKWGFIWSLLCALMWGIGYVPLSVIWNIDPLASGYGFADPDKGFLVTSYMDAFLQAITFGIVLTVFWAGCTGKLGEYKRVFTNMNLLKWLFIGALFGGPMAIFGAALATGYVGAAFAASIALLSSVVGAVVGRFLNHEKLAKKTIIGLLVILVGGVIMCDPQALIDNLSAGGSPIGYLGGVLSAIGWGVEGNIAIRTLEVTDADASLPVRFSVEAIFWCVILMPVMLIWLGVDDFVDVICQGFGSSGFVFWMFMAAFSLGFCYAAQYKAFPLIGVGKTLAMCTMYVPVSYAALAVFLGQPLGYMLIIGAVIAIAGTFVMYWESGESAGSSNRDMGGQ